MKIPRVAVRLGVRTVLVLVVAGLLYGGLYALPIKRAHDERLKHTNATKLYGLVRESSFMVQEITQLRGLESSDQMSLSTLASKLAANTRKLTDLRSEAKRLLGQADFVLFEQTLEEQGLLLAHLQGRYEVLSKLVAYDPSTDLGGLGIDSQDAGLLSRTSAAHEAMQALANAGTFQKTSASGQDTSFVLPDALKAPLELEVRCLSELQASLEPLQSQNAQLKRNECIALYPKVRETATLFIIGPFSDQRGKTLLGNLTKLATQN